MGDTWVVVIGDPAVGGCGNSQSLRMADAFYALGNKVLYIESGGGKHRKILKKQSGNEMVFADMERRGMFFMVAAYVPGMPPGLPEFVRRWNTARTSARAAMFLQSQNAEKVYAFHYTWLMRGLFKSEQNAVKTVYECTELHRKEPGLGAIMRKRIARTEARLLERADLTIFATQYLADCSSFPVKQHLVLPPAVDPDHFGKETSRDPHERLGLTEDEMKAPKIGFIGSFTGRHDWSIIRNAAKLTPQWTWLLGGHGGGSSKDPQNLHWLGTIKYEETPAWLQRWDVGILPLTPWSEYNRGTYPIKLNEYLAAGLPVVSTSIPAAQALAKEAPGCVFILDEHSPRALVKLLGDAINVSPKIKESAKVAARENTWLERAKTALSHANLT